ncbi:MAG: hypothetical protein ACREJC_12985, partial [Tepidisphaeraceae bacterium]
MTSGNTDNQNPVAPARGRGLWRRWLVFLLVLLVLSPLTGLAGWWLRDRYRQRVLHQMSVNPPGPRDDLLAYHYVRYMQNEGHDRRGPLFEELAATMNRRLYATVRSSAPMSMAELEYYLGTPDRVVDNQRWRSVIYRYIKSDGTAWYAYASIDTSTTPVGVMMVVTGVTEAAAQGGGFWPSIQM